MKLKLFQKQDIARAALKDGLIFGWDTGLGKTWALFLWSLLKVGFARSAPNDRGEKLCPKGPVLIIAPGDLHDQISSEGKQYFGILVRTLDCQATFDTLTRIPNTRLTNLTPDGRPIIEAGFYITSYTQLTSNGVAKMPDPDAWDARALLEWLSLGIGKHQPIAGDKADLPSSYLNVCHFFAWRGRKWRDEYDILGIDPRSTLIELDEALARAERGLERWVDKKAAASQSRRYHAAYGILKNLCGPRRDSQFVDLTRPQQDYVIRAFCVAKLTEYSAKVGEYKDFPIGDPPPDYNPAVPESDTRPKRRIKCVYSPSLSDLCYNAFDAVVIDEGVKMKGEDTLVGRGVRATTPKYSMVLTATPIKNRLPDVFRLAWWATGGHTEAHARWPYRDDSSERTKFAETFMVSEHNLTKEKEAKARGDTVKNGRFNKLTAEVCNVHRLWKLFGPIILRRRKQDSGVDIVPTFRRIIRCEMGTQQKKVYQYHLAASYRDVNGLPAVGAQLQALRMAAADPSSSHLVHVLGNPVEPCECGRAGTKLLKSRCPKCNGAGTIPLPHRSDSPYTPKMATTLTLIHEILERREQFLVFSAFNDPLDHLSRWLSEAGVRHLTLDGRVSQKRRAKLAALFKRGRFRAGSDEEASIPGLLCGVECMAEGHSFHLANNAILFAYSWAADKFKQALDRIYRLNSVKPVNIYVVICQGTIDRKLESLTDEKTNSSELVLDGRLLGERPEEINLAELLKIAQREFNATDNTIDEALLQSQWPALRQRLSTAMRAWDSFDDCTIDHLPVAPRIPQPLPMPLPLPIAPMIPQPELVLPAFAPDWRSRMRERTRVLTAKSSDLWAQL